MGPLPSGSLPKIGEGATDIRTKDTAAPDVKFEAVTKRYGAVLAVDAIDLEVSRGAFMSLLGPSGCGKTTSLRLIAGFDQPTSGDIHIAGRQVSHVPSYQRPVNMVFQHYALFPHLNVADNTAYGLRQLRPRPSKAEIRRRVDETLEMVRLPGYQKRRVWELSGGQQQRVALARALINRPTVLLLDEPLAALDRKLRREMQIELQTLQREVGITFILVTHDQEEALSMSDRVSLMRDGRIVQTGSPQDLYDAPIDRYVADFVGKSNFFEGTLAGIDGGDIVVRLDCGLAMRGRRPCGAASPTRETRLVIAVRPELIRIMPRCEAPGVVDPAASDFHIGARVKNRIFLGEHTEYLVTTDALGDVLVLSPKRSEAASGGFSPGDEVTIEWQGDTALALDDD